MSAHREHWEEALGLKGLVPASDSFSVPSYPSPVRSALTPLPGRVEIILLSHPQCPFGWMESPWKCQLSYPSPTVWSSIGVSCTQTLSSPTGGGWAPPPSPNLLILRARCSLRFPHISPTQWPECPSEAKTINTQKRDHNVLPPHSAQLAQEHQAGEAWVCPHNPSPDPSPWPCPDTGLQAAPTVDSPPFQSGPPLP